MTGEVRNLEITLNVSKGTFIDAIFLTHPAEFLHEREGACQSSKCRRDVIRWTPSFRRTGKGAIIEVCFCRLDCDQAFLTEGSGSLYQSKSSFREALCDSFNTPAAVDALRDIVSKANVYINSRGKALNVKLVENIADWVGKMLRMFGLGEGERSDIGWGQIDESGGSSNVCFTSCLVVENSIHHFSCIPFQREEILMPSLRVLSSFRDNIRKLAIAKEETALKDILALCDKLRDNDLVLLGVALDDQEGLFFN